MGSDFFKLSGAPKFVKNKFSVFCVRCKEHFHERANITKIPLKVGKIILGSSFSTNFSNFFIGHQFGQEYFLYGLGSDRKCFHDLANLRKI